MYLANRIEAGNRTDYTLCSQIGIQDNEHLVHGNLQSCVSNSWWFPATVATKIWVFPSIVCNRMPASTDDHLPATRRYHSCCRKSLDVVYENARPTPQFATLQGPRLVQRKCGFLLLRRFSFSGCLLDFYGLHPLSFCFWGTWYDHSWILGGETIIFFQACESQ